MVPAWVGNKNARGRNSVPGDRDMLKKLQRISQETVILALFL